MATSPIITKARKVASIIGAVLLAYASLWCIVIATLLFLGLWLHMLYYTGLAHGLDLSVPLKNFSGRGVNLSIPKMTPFQFDNHDDINLELIQMGAFTLYGTVMALSAIIFPQLVGGILLLKATDLDIGPKAAYDFACRHQLTQRVVCSIELVLLILLCCCFINWDVMRTPRLFAGFVVMLLFVIIRFRLMTQVEKFIDELWVQMGGSLPPGDDDGYSGWCCGQYRYRRMGNCEREKLGETKKAKAATEKLGYERMEAFIV